MKLKAFLIFIAIVIITLGGINYYILYHGLKILPPESGLRSLLIGSVIFLTYAYIIGRFTELISVNVISTALIWIGAFYWSVMVYIFLQLLLLDFLNLFNGLLGIFPNKICANFENILVAYVVLPISLLTTFLGFINARNPKLKSLNLIIKKHSPMKNLKIAMVSDIHLGTIYGKKFLAKIVKHINELNPDIILIPGDIIDEDIAPVIKANMGEELKKCSSKYGIYAVTGNHEYIAGVENSKKYLKGKGINILSDEAVLIDGSFYVAGREDLAKVQFAHQKRKELSEILNGIDKSLPVILLDHQPFYLEQAEANGVDLQLSGHTHYGQLWPFNFLTKAIYEKSWGYLKKGETQYYISCGVGGWGPPVRTGSYSEIVEINLTFAS
jgi:predicted MPP superfamily phosphohydrolase